MHINMCGFGWSWIATPLYCISSVVHLQIRHNCPWHFLEILAHHHCLVDPVDFPHDLALVQIYDSFDSVSPFETTTFLHIARILVPTTAIVCGCVLCMMWILLILTDLFFNDAYHNVITLAVNDRYLKREGLPPRHLHVHQQLTLKAIISHFSNFVKVEVELRDVRSFQEDEGVETNKVLQFLLEYWEFLSQLLVGCF